MPTAQPDAWDIGAADWDTDIRFDSSMSQLGDGSMHFIDTTPAGDPYIIWRDAISVAPSHPYRIVSLLQADSIAAGDTMLVRANWYTSAGAYISSSPILNWGVLSAAGSWLEYAGVVTSPATAAMAKLLISKNNSAFNAWADYADILAMPRCFHAYRAGAAQVASCGGGAGAWTKMSLDGEVYDYGGMWDAAANYRFDVPADGIYGMSATVGFTLAAAGAIADIAFYLDGVIWIQGTKIETPTSGNVVRCVISVPAAYLQRGQYVELYIYNKSSNNAFALTGSSETMFMGAALQP